MSTGSATRPVGIQDLLAPKTRHILYRILQEASSSSTGTSVSKDFIDIAFYRVCKSWRNLLKTQVIRVLSHPNNNYGYEDISNIDDNDGKLLYYSCYFYDIKDTTLPPRLKYYTSFLRSASILKPISNPNFVKLIPLLQHIQSLTLDQFTLYKLNNQVLFCLNGLEQLQVLIITGEYSTRPEIDEMFHDRNHNTNMLRNVLDNFSFKKLVQLGVKAFVLPDADHDGYIVESFLHCMATHQKTLKHVTFETRLLQFQQEQEDDEQAKNSKKSSPKSPYIPKLCLASLKELQLTSLFFGGQHSSQPAWAQEIFKQILETQLEAASSKPKQLRSVFCDFSKIPNPISAKNLAARKPKTRGQYFNNSLICLELMLCEGGQDTKIDCKVLFSHCKQLRVLTLSAANTSAKPDTSRLEPQLLNVSSLPKTLEILRIRGLHIDKTFGGFIVGELPKLKFLELVEIGAENGLGLHFKLFAEMMDNGRIKQLVFSKAFNKESMVEYMEKNTNAAAGGDQPYNSQDFEDREKEHVFICLQFSSVNQYQIVPNNEFQSVTYFPTNNLYLQHALTFTNPLAFKEYVRNQACAAKTEVESEREDGNEAMVVSDKEESESEQAEQQEEEGSDSTDQDYASCKEEVNDATAADAAAETSGSDTETMKEGVEEEVEDEVEDEVEEEVEEEVENSDQGSSAGICEEASDGDGDEVEFSSGSESELDLNPDLKKMIEESISSWLEKDKVTNTEAKSANVATPSCGQDSTRSEKSESETKSGEQKDGSADDGDNSNSNSNSNEEMVRNIIANIRCFDTDDDD